METPTEASSESGARPSLGHLRIRPSPSRPCPWLPGLNGGPRGVSVLGTQSGNAKDTGACTECFLFVGPRALPGFGCRLKNPEVFDRRTCRKFHSKFGDLDQALVAGKYFRRLHDVRRVAWCLRSWRTDGRRETWIHSAPSPQFRPFHLTPGMTWEARSKFSWILLHHFSGGYSDLISKFLLWKTFGESSCIVLNEFYELPSVSSGYTVT